MSRDLFGQRLYFEGIDTMTKVREVEVGINGRGGVEELDLGDCYCFWLAYTQHIRVNKPDVWHTDADPWHVLLQKDLVYVMQTLPGVAGDDRGAFYRFAVTRKGADVLDTLDPAVITDHAIRGKIWALAAEWMAAISPEHLPMYLSHESNVVREMALARVRFLKQHGWPNEAR